MAPHRQHTIISMLQDREPVQVALEVDVAQSLVDICPILSFHVENSVHLNAWKYSLIVQMIRL